jgi:hypothetical protein
MKWIFSDVTYTDLLDKLNETDVVNLVRAPIGNDDVIRELVTQLLAHHNDLTETSRELAAWFDDCDITPGYSGHDLTLLVMECGIDTLLQDTARILQRMGKQRLRLDAIVLGPVSYTIEVTPIG